MWHEARRMEKAVYQAINTTAKRKELARRAHDLANVSKDPSELLCIYGNALTIHTDANIAQAADESNTMTKWQGDESLIIDRFDARNLLDAIPTKPRSNDPEEPSNVEEYITALQLDYERFKELIAIAFTGECETTVLKNIAARDGRVALAKTAKKEKKLFNNKKPVNKKAAIKFNYDNEDATGSNDNAGPSNSKSAPREGSDSSDDDDNDDDELFSAKISSILFSTQDWERIDMIAEKFHLPRDAFSKLYEVDRGDELDVAKLQEIERERLSLSGRSSRRDRAKLKRRKKLILKDPLNDDAVFMLRRFAERRLREIKAEDASSSNSDDGEIEEKTEFITCFGESGIPTELPKTGSNRSPTRTTTNVTTSNVRTSRIKRDSRSASPFGDAWGSLKSTAKSNGETSEVVTSKIKKPIVPSSKPSGSGWLSSRMQNLRQKRSPSPVSPPSSRQSSVGKSGDDQPLVIRSSMSESEQERLEIENRKRRVRRTKRELKKRAKPSPDDNGSDDEESRKRAIAAKKLKQHLQANLSKTHREMLNDERDKKTQIENELKSRNAGDYVQRRPSRSLSPPHRQNQKSHSRSRSTSREAQNRRSMSRSPRRYRSRSRSPVRDHRRHTRNHRDRRSRSPHYRHRRSRSSERYYRRRRHYSRSRSPRDRR